jgi:hypothetical protein
VAHGKQYAQTSQSMSDALSDSARDQQRTEASREMWQAFGAFAEAPSAERKQAVLEATLAWCSITSRRVSGVI